MNSKINSLRHSSTSFQCDTEEIDRLSGRVRVNRSKFTNRYERPTVAKPSTNASTAAATPSKTQTATTPPAAEKPKEVPPQPPPPQPTAQPAVPLPKQSGFVPRQRIYSVGGGEKAQSSGPAAVAASKTTAATAATDDEDDASPAPTQSSFLQRKWNKDRQREEELEAKRKEEEKKRKKLLQERDNISLRDSIEKVKSWKEQFQTSGSLSTGAPSTRSDELDINAILGQDDQWRKTKPIGRPGQSARNDVADDEPPAPPSSRKTTAKKTFGGVPAFPDESVIATKDDSSKLSVPKNKNQERSPSPYDNVKNQHLRPVSPYDNCKPPPADGKAKNVYPSMESLGGFAGDVSGSSDDESSTTVGRHQHLKPPSGCIANIPGKMAASSLPDLVTSSELGGRRSPSVVGKKFIGQVKNIEIGHKMHKKHVFSN